MLLFFIILIFGFIGPFIGFTFAIFYEKELDHMPAELAAIIWFMVIPVSIFLFSIAKIYKKIYPFILKYENYLREIRSYRQKLKDDPKFAHQEKFKKKMRKYE